MDKKHISMDDIIDNQCALIMELSNHVLSYKEMLKKNDVDSEISSVLPSYIDEYTKVINEFTNNSADFILIWTRQINDAYEKLEKEEDYNKREHLEYSISILKDSIKKKIVKPNKEIVEEKIDKSSKKTSFKESQKVDLDKVKESPKSSSFRENQKINIDPVSQAIQISKLCKEHQDELRAEDLKNKGISR